MASYEIARWRNFSKCHERDESPLFPVFRLPSTGVGWDASADSTHPLDHLEDSVGAKITVPNLAGILGSDGNSIRYGFGLSTTPAVDITFNNMDFFIEFRSESGVHTVKTYKPRLTGSTPTLLGAGPGFVGTYRLEIVSGLWKLLINDANSFIDLNNLDLATYPLYVYVFCYNNVYDGINDIGINIEVNSEGYADMGISSYSPPLYSPYAVTQPIFEVHFNYPISGTPAADWLTLTKASDGSPVNDLTLTKAGEVLYIKVNEVLDYSEEYIIEYVANKIRNANNSYLPNTIASFSTASEFTVLTDAGINLNTNTNDIYWKAQNLYKLLDIDSIFGEFANLFNFAYKPTDYDVPNSKYVKREIEINDIVLEEGETLEEALLKQYVVHDNKALFQDLLQRQFMSEMGYFFDEIKTYNESTDDPLVSTEEQDKLKALFLRNITNINYFKGTDVELDFILSLFARSVGKTIGTACPDPYDLFVYRVNTDAEKEQWRRSLRETSHPNSWRDRFFLIPPVQNISADISSTTEAVSDNPVTLSYLDVGRLQNDPELNPFHELRSVRESANASIDNMLEHRSYRFNHSKYNVSVNYEGIVNNILRDPSRITASAVKHYRTSNPAFTIVYNPPASGLATHFIWEFWARGSKKFEQKTYAPFINIIEGDKRFDWSWEVRVRLVNEFIDFSVTAQPIQVLQYIHQNFRRDSELQGQTYLDFRVSEPTNLHQQFDFEAISWHGFMKTTLLNDYADLSYGTGAHLTLIDDINNLTITDYETLPILTFDIPGHATGYIWKIATVADPTTILYEIRTQFPVLTFPLDFDNAPYEVELTIENNLTDPMTIIVLSNKYYITGGLPDEDPPIFEGSLSATDENTDGCVSLLWNPATDLTEPIFYNIYWATSPGAQDFESDPQMISSSSTGDEVCGLTNGLPYYFVVRSIDSSLPPNEDTNTNEVSATPTLQDIIPPIFSGLGMATDTNTDGEVTLTWSTGTDADSPPINYNIYWATSSGAQDFESDPQATTLENNGITVSGLTNGIPYYFVVRAEDSARIPNEDTNTNEFSAIPTPAITIPDAPVDLTLTVLSDTIIELNWTDVATNEDGYKIERKTGSGGTFIEIDDIAADSIFYSDNTCASGTEYYYRVSAYNITGNSPYSNIVSEITFIIGGEEVVQGDVYKHPYILIAPNGITKNIIASNTTLDDIEHYYYSGGSWISDTIATDMNGGSCHAGIDSNGFIHILYLKTDSSLQYLTNATGSWVVSQVSASALSPTGIHIDSNGKVHAVCNVWPDIYYINNVSGSWVIDSTPNGGYAGTDITYNETTGAVYIAGWKGVFLNGIAVLNNLSGWTTDVVVPANYCNNAPTIAIDGNDVCHMVCDVVVGGTGILTNHYSNSGGSFALDSTIGTNISNGQPFRVEVDSNDKLHFMMQVSGTRFCSHVSNKTGSWVETPIYSVQGAVSADYYTCDLDSLDNVYGAFIKSGSQAIEYCKIITTFALSIPSNLQATPVSGTEIDLTWADESYVELGFKIERKTGLGGTYAQIDTVGENIEFYADETVEDGIEYYYRIRAYDALNDSDYSNEANATAAGAGMVSTQWNPLDTHVNITISDVGRHIVNTVQDGSIRLSRGDQFKSSGAYYIEFPTGPNLSDVSYGMTGGVCTAAVSLAGWFAGGSQGWGASVTLGVGLQKVWNNSSTTIIADSGVSGGEIIMMAVNCDTGKIWFGMNGTWSGDPVAGTGEAYSGIMASGDLAVAGGVSYWITQKNLDLRADPITQTYAAPVGFGEWNDIYVPPPAFAQWNAADAGSNILITGVNNEILGTSSGLRGCRGLYPRNSGKLYVEYEFTTITGAAYETEAGIATSSAGLENIAGASSYGFVMDVDNNIGIRKVTNGTPTSILSGAFTHGSTGMMAVDLDTGKVWFGCDNAWSGDPVAGTGEAFNSATISSNDIYLIGSVAPSSVLKMRSNPTDHVYSPPTGFTAGWEPL